MDWSPAPVVFDIDRDRSARFGRELRSADDGGQPSFAYAAPAMLWILNGLLRLRSYGTHDTLAWLLIVFWSGYIALMWRRRKERSFVRLERATTVTFHDTGVTVAREDASSVDTQFFPFADIRSVRLTSETIVLYGLWGLILVVPRTAIANGAAVMAYFEEHIVSRGLPQNSSDGVTTLQNSLWPLLARRKRNQNPSNAR